MATLPPGWNDFVVVERTTAHLTLMSWVEEGFAFSARPYAQARHRRAARMGQLGRSDLLAPLGRA
ncbi:MAG: hypothetical protein JWN48_884 [Myxococcaceae bacterium]|nr:hypothetical protein [Myxococcaceae bacterium]